ncbi:hypothetical protein GLOIN_2v1881585 [Rhizophagus irregularis DAOM 181602=DAOM 197198]|uniref:Actin-like ATPase domain-containing protein n=1 Tax=Rhizophagus irregularis (strain DAOM 181602 / DAOM 197198 / MUCL 43194) TaxID=747089 RepID=U9TKF1_RHIID|nr:hypothetical protein GLOIN_2v1881585 [Rhizophagus irregularis DAOM 181602=DAOM 197198]POG64096.1 hypothetical protein GLOIN_2v1881585 [Rhizophagus irregularis DAOM 181602=DAOM 197198]CAG8645693.1 5603_t:CDS:2 [Rhizophagus irregularis]|eukprot:XP_025170962.1 hypothetical protein GLOIN_2v1881585 [Rhizophagus irregularis DAOM 181602=DAOM 197198]
MEDTNFLENNIRVVVGLDFGTTYSGFAYCHVCNERNVCSNDNWHGEVGQLKTNTVLQYDDTYNVKLWGAPAMAKKPNRRNRGQNNERNRPVELFKLYLEDLSDKLKPNLPVEYKKAITDYLREISKVIKETVGIRWPKIEYFENVLLILTVPAEFSEKSKAIMRICAFDAELIKEACSTNLQFTTEPEAAAVYCMKNLEKQNFAQPGTNFMIVDCGGGTVDLTTHKFINNEQLSEITERAGDCCGSTFIDDEFVKYLRKTLGDEPMDLLRDNNYDQMQYLIQQFCKYGKISFTGDDPDFLYELDIRDTIPILEQQYIVDDDIRETLEKNEWVIEIDFETMKSIFEPVVRKILKLIKVQLDNAQETCSAMFLVGGFSESKYLQKRIKQEFSPRINDISVPIQPMAAISRGAVIYGLSIRLNDLNTVGNNENMKCVISSREREDPVHRKTQDGFIEKFQCLVRRGTKININQEIKRSRVPIHSEQNEMIHCLYYTKEYEAEYCDDPGMELLGKLHIDLPGSGLDRPVLFGITFGNMEITATSKNELTGQSYKAIFKFDLDN